ncbi:hypothetical protein SEPCBS119000_004014 [Sporothrix epigloea]|uniref:Uncharacterized protein n=1 Tax=Sporothrix epigloea TaxID=1892477 RepID=A0ABP0DQ13_9PEZI
MQAAELPAPEPALRLSPADNLERPGATSGLPIQIPSASNASWTTPKSEDDYKFLSSYDSGSSPQGTSPSSARRSISMNFSSQTSRIPKGGLDRPKRNSEYPPNASLTGSLRTNKKIGSAAISRNAPPNEQRHVSAPLARPRPFTAQPHHQHLQIRRSATPFADIDPQKPSGDATWQPCYSDANECQEDEGSSFSAQPSFVRERASLNRQRHTSSPFPPLSRFSDFNINLESLEVSPGASRLLATNKENHAYALPGLAKVSRSFPLATSSGNVLDTPSSTLAGLDLDPQDIASSVDGEDTDLKSDTIFDSIRTTASARLQSVGTPVESMFDESPPSTAGNGKAKRLSIQEILGQATDSDTRIAEEEDDGVSTPMRTICDLQNGSLIPKSVMNFRDEDSHFEFGRQDFAETKANIIFSSTTTDKSARAISSRNSRPSFEDDDGDDDWARIDDSGVTNHLSPPSRAPCDSFDETSGPIFANGPELGFSRHQRPALGLISGNGSLDPAGRHDGSIASGHERPKSTLFDWCEAAPHSDKIGSESHSPRPKTAHGKQELDLKNRRPVNRKGPAVTHARSQSVPVNLDPTTQGAKPVKPQFGTWAAGPKNASEDWDDDFDFDSNTDADADDIDENRLSGIEEDDAFGQSSTLRSSKGPNSSFAMVVPASIQATQPTVKAHSGQIRELSLLVHGLKRLCRHARDLNIVDETPALWKEAENIIALASPDEDLYETAAMKATKASAATAVTDASVKKAAPGSDSSVPRASIEFDVSGVEDQILSGQCSHESPTRFEDDLFDTSDPTQRLTSPTPPEVSRTAVVRERPHTRRRSVFSPDDDIFGGNSPRAGDKSYSAERIEAKEAHRRPQTPHRSVGTNETPDSTMIESIMEAMQQQRSASAPIRKSPVKQSPASELFFNTNTLQELVKRANSLFHTLSELVRRTELFTQSPAVTPRRDRLNRCEDGSPAFTRVFTDPSSPLKRLPKSQSGNSITRGSPALESPSTTKVSQRLQLMTLS